MCTEKKSGKEKSEVEDEANTEVPLYDVIETESGEGKDVTEGYIHDQLGIKLTCVQVSVCHIQFLKCLTKRALACSFDYVTTF